MSLSNNIRCAQYTDELTCHLKWATKDKDNRLFTGAYSYVSEGDFRTQSNKP